MELPFRIATLLLLTAAIAISIYFRHRAERAGGKLDQSQGGALLIVLRLFGLAGLLPLLLYIVNPVWVAWARFDAPDALRWIAMLIAAMMLPGIYWLYSTIGNNISPRETTRADHALITSGPYRYIRHPLYTFGGIFFTALCIGATIWWTLLLLAIGLALLLYRTPREEANLIARFGDDYRRYMARTGRYFPKLT